MRQTLRIHFSFIKLRFLDAPGLFLLETALTGGMHISDVLANMVILQLVLRFLAASDYGTIMILIGCFVVYQLMISWIYNWYMNRVYPEWKEKFFYRQSDRLYRIMLQADCTMYGEEAWFHSYRKAIQFLHEKMEDGIILHRELLGCFLNGIIAVYLYLMIDPGVLLFLLLAYLGSCFCRNRIVETIRQKRDGQNRKDAAHQSYLRAFLSRECAAEGRVLGYLPFLNRKDQMVFSEKEKISMEKNRRLLPMLMGKEFLGEFLFIDFLVVAWLGYCFFMKKSIGIDGFAASINGTHIILYAFSVLFGQMSVALGEQADYMGAFLDFGSFRQTPGQEDARELIGNMERLQLSHADFAYGGEEILHDISMGIRKGERIAIVGPSGAGKTTLVKAILGLGKLKHGSVYVNGMALREEAGAQYRSHFTVLFAENSLFAATLGQNVSLSEAYQEEKAIKALRASGLYTEEEEVPVGKQVLRELEEGGLLFSGGQKQKIELARVLYHDADFVIADEAAASLDPFAEDAFNRRILQENETKGVIVISHRLSVTAMVDCIYVIERGKIAEKGSHQELLAQRGIYYRMWTKQTKDYQN